MKKIKILKQSQRLNIGKQPNLFWADVRDEWDSIIKEK